MQLLKRSIADYLAHRAGPEAIVEHAERFGRGSSRLTWFVDYRVSLGADLQQVVFRGDFAGGSTIPTSLEQEYSSTIG